MTLPRRPASLCFTAIASLCLAFSLPLLLGCSTRANAADRQTLADWQDASRDELKSRFDEVARNLGIVEAAYYTYTLEFREVPATAQDLIDSGHLRAEMTNPYTGKPIRFPSSDSISAALKAGEIGAGDIWFHPDVEGGELGIAGLYLNPNDPKLTKWMQRQIVRYYEPATHTWLYGDAPDPKTHALRVSMEHLLSAIEEYEIRFGTVPYDFNALKLGDMRVEYPNPWFPTVNMRPCESPHAGDFYYQRLADDDYILIGWGDTGPAWFQASSFENWGVQLTDTSPVGWKLITKDAVQIGEIDRKGPEAFVMPTDYLLNREVAIHYMGWQLDQQRIADWNATHPECTSCGSTYVFWAKRDDGSVVCVDETNGDLLDDCCCRDLPKSRM